MLTSIPLYFSVGQETKEKKHEGDPAVFFFFWYAPFRVK